MRALSLLLALATAQATPNFTGVWETVSITPKPPGGATALSPAPLTIVQTPERVVVSRTAFDRVTSTTYSLDGREDRNHSGAVTRLTRSTWTGTSLVTEGRMSQTTSQGYAAWAIKETMRLDATGQLVMEVHTRGDDGAVFDSVITLRRTGSRK